MFELVQHGLLQGMGMMSMILRTPPPPGATTERSVNRYHALQICIVNRILIFIFSFLQVYILRYVS